MESRIELIFIKAISAGLRRLRATRICSLLIAASLALTAASVSAQQTSTFRWWHNLDNGYSFGEWLGIYGNLIVTGTPVEGYYGVSGAHQNSLLIYINSAGDWSTRYNGKWMFVLGASAPPATAYYDLNSIAWSTDPSLGQGNRDVQVSISGGGSVDVVDQPYRDGDGNVPHTDYTTNYLTVPYSVHFGPVSTPTPTPTPGANTKCNDDRVAGNQPTCASCSGAGSAGGGTTPPTLGMARYSVHSMLVSLNIQDTPLHYSPAYGPAVDFTVTYDQRESQQPATFNYSNLGPKWTFGWLSYVSDDPNTQLPLTGIYRSGGGAEIFAFDSGSQTFTPDAQSHATLVKTGAASYERRLPDGSKEIYGLSDGATSYPRRIFMTQIVDAAGNPLSIGYDASFRVATITDALSQITNISYELPADPLKITKVTDPFGRFATFSYTNGQLTMITDEIGIQSQFGYATGSDFINSLTTPYGTTTFTAGENGTNRWIEATDPLGGEERVEYRDQAPGISASDPVAPNATGITNAGLDMANTFYWDKKAMLVAPGDYTKAVIKHWLYNPDGSVSGILSSEKQPLENRVWHTYAGQSDYQHAGPSANPSQTARVLGDGSTQLSQFEYNSIGKTTKSTDPVGRVMSYIYDTNNIDLLETRQTKGTNNELLRKFTYNVLHEPLTDTDAAGQVTTYTYNAQGQVLTRKNAKNETTTYAYGSVVPAGCLASVTSPPFNSVSAVTTFTYDSFKRVRTVTDSDNYTVTTDYDNLDRKIKVTYPDTTFEQFQYTDNVTGAMTLDLTGSRDRRGLWTYRHYNANQKMDSITDPANRTTQYGWCTCGALTGITDPNNQMTTFYRDIQSRVYQKAFQDGTTIDYLYEGQSAPNTVGATSRLKSSTDAKNQRTNYAYFADDNVQQVSYTNALVSTPTVNYTYDPNYNRVSTMTDGIGLTTYGYEPITVPPALGAGQLASIDGPLTNDTVSFGYDELGRTTSRSVNGAANSDTVGFDSLGRMSSETNNLGTFDYVCVGVTNRLQTVNYPNGQSTSFSYFPNSGDKQLQTLRNLRPNMTSQSRFDYVYDAEHMITQWTRQADGVSAQPTYFEYDHADQLAVFENRPNPTGLRGDYVHSFVYDPAGNRQTDKLEQWAGLGAPSSTTERTGSFNSVNALSQEITQQQTEGGPPLDDEFPPPPPADVYSYDPNGNTISRVYADGSSNTFEWDAANRLAAITYGGNNNRTEFTYDGLGHYKKIVEKNGATVTSTKQFVWIGNRIAEERDANNVVTQRYFAHGEERVGTGAAVYYYTKDHLGSIRELTDAAGSLRARYDYDPFGNATKVSGDLSVNFDFTGHYRHTASNLYLAPYRAYDPTVGRWLSRDSLEDAETSEGPNLYSYVRNNPSGATDPLGLATKTFTKTDGVTEWADMWSHAGSHFARPWQGFGAKYGRPARVVYHNVCSDPVYKLLKSVKASNGWGAYIDGPNDAHIDVSSHRAIWERLTWQDPAKGVSLIAECSDGCTL